jgi:purine-binding chemotaxis protein CheW
MHEMAAARSGEIDSAAMGRKLAERAKVLRRRMESDRPEAAEVSFLAFTKGPQRYGIAVSDVIEVETLRQFTPVPGAPDFVPGVINWRGTILSLLDLGKLFQIPETGLADLHACVIVEAAGPRVAVVAGEIEEIVSTASDQLRPAPERAGDIHGDWVAGIHDENRIVLRMDQVLQDPRVVEWRK